MTRQTLILALLASLSTIGCPGSREQVVAKDDRPPPTRVSSSGIGFRLSNADDEVAAIEEREVAAGIPLGDAEAARLLARLPTLVAQADDAQNFSLPVRSMPAPRPGTTVEVAFPPKGGSPPVGTRPTGPLRVERFSPEGEVPLAPNVSLTFSEPMVPITSIGGLSKEAAPAQISPEPEGSWSWLGTRTLVFQPAKRLPMATSFSVRVPAGTKAMSGQALAEEVRWSFTTPPPTLESWIPRGRSVPLDPVIFVAFDQGIDPAEMLSSIEVTAGDKEISTRLATRDEVEADRFASRALQRAGEGRWLAFRPTERLPKATKVKVRIAKGAKGAEGPLHTVEDQEFEFETFGALWLSSSACGWVFLGGECTPETPFFVRFSNDLDRARFDPKLVTVSPEIPGMKVDVSGNTLGVRGRKKGRTKYTVTIEAGLTDVHGQTLGKPSSESLQVGATEPRLMWAEREMAVLDPTGPAEYVAYSINERALRTRVYAVTPEDWKAYASWRRERQLLRWQERNKSMPPGRLVLDKVIHPKDTPDELVETPIDLSAALDQGLGHAVVHVVAAREYQEYERHNEVIVWVQATKLGLHAFLEPDSATAWVTNLEDGAPLDDVGVYLAGAGTSASTKDGLATLPISSNGYPLVAKQGSDTTFLTEGGFGNESFVVWREPRMPHWFVFDDRGLYKPGEAVHVKGWVRSDDLTRGGDLGLPKPDAVVQYRVRDPRGPELTSGRVTVDDQGAFDFDFVLPKNVNLGRAQVELHLIGSSLRDTEAHPFSIEEFRKPEYAVQTGVSEGPHFVGDQAVAAVTASYYSGGGLPGAPVAWTIQQTSTSFTPPHRSDFHFGPAPKWSSWLWRDEEKPEKEETWSARTDAGGSHRLRLSFDALEPAYPFKLTLTSSVEDLNRQRWSGRASMLVHPSDRYVGLRLVRNFVRAGDPIAVDLLVVDLDGVLVGARPVEARAARLENIRRGAEYVDEETDVQRCRVESTTDATPVRCSFATTGGGRYRVTAVVEDEQGRKNLSTIETWVLGGSWPAQRRLDADHVTVVLDKNEYVPGETATVLVISPFAPAEGVLSVRRQGIVHLERFTMQETSQTLQVKLDDSMVPNVEIGVDLVGAALREGTDGEDDPSLPRRPAYASGSAKVKLLPSTRTLAVRATPKTPILSPGGRTTIDVEVRAPDGRPAKGAEVAVIVVDEAVLALSGRTAPDPLAVFYQDREADVRTLQSREDIILGRPQAELGAFPHNGLGVVIEEALGGSFGKAHGLGGLGSRGRGPRKMLATGLLGSLQDTDGSSPVDEDAPIDVRSDFASLALFAPRVRTDVSGRASVPLNLPDNLTRYRVMAVASTGTNFFGSTEATITARLPLMVRPSAPRFLNFGDSFELSVLIQNQTDAPVDAAVAARATNATMNDTAKRVTIPANDRVEVRFPVSTLQVGTARFQIGVAAPGFADASQIELPVYTPATTEAFATYGELDGGAVAQPMRMPDGVFTQFGGLEVSTSSTQLQALTDAVLYLTRYPFECNEQVASRVISIAALRDVLTAFRAEGLPAPEELQASVEEDLARLDRTQHTNGGWSFWQGQPETWPYITVHVAHALVRAKEKGYESSRYPLERAMVYLRDIEAHIPDWYGLDARRSIVAYALYVRWRNGDADPVHALQLIADAGGVEQMPLEALGWILPTLSSQTSSEGTTYATSANYRSTSNSTDDVAAAIRRHIGNRVTETAGAAHFVTSYGDEDWVLLHSDRRVDGVLLEALIADQPESTLIPKLVKGLLGHRKAGRWLNTQENAFVLLALDRYFATYEKTTPDFVARMWLGDRFAGEHAFRGRTTEQSELRIPMAWLAKNAAGTRDLVLGKDGPGRLYYRIGMQYAPTDLKLPPIDRGFAVSRRYEGADRADDVRRDEDGTWHVRLGARVRVRVSMVAPERRYHVALVDPLPAGFEPLNPALVVTGVLPKDPKAEKDAAQGSAWWRWLWSRTWYEHQNLRDDRAEAFASLLYDGVWDYTYVATATTPGTFVTPPPKAEEMYSPETFGRGAQDRVIVE